MREIKFRAWDERNRDMVYSEEEDSFYIDLEGANFSYCYDNQTARDFNKPIIRYASYELMQYTGLKDKEGKEIYEGDILRLDGGRLVEVRWHPFAAQFDSRAINSKGMARPLADRPQFFSEVIGNIYENPELLEG